MRVGVKGDGLEIRAGAMNWAGLEALWLTPPLPLVVCACLDDPQWSGALALPPSATDLADAQAYPADARRWRFLQRRAVLRGLVARCLGLAGAEVVVGHDRFGAPRLLQPVAGMHISVAGRGAPAAFAIAYGPMGVDLEPVGATLEPAWNVLHARERAWLEALAPALRHNAFLQLWTVKEAYLKMRGLGLRIEPAMVAAQIEVGGRAQIAEGARLYQGQWRQVQLGGQATLVACCRG